MSGKKTIGIHLRGTDKHLEVPDTNPKLIFDEANKQADLIGQCQFLVVTDEYRLLELAKKELNRPVIYYECRRSSDGSPLYYKGNFFGVYAHTHDALKGEEFLIEFILLSKYFIFIHTASNASALPFYFNPELLGMYFSPKGEIVYF